MKDIYAQMTDHIISSLDEAGQWKPCWRGSNSGLPINAKTGKKYQGVNVISLWLSPYSSNRWASFKQWQDMGACVKKGERGTPIIFYKVLEGETREDDKLLTRGSYVFNAAQVEGDAKGEVSLPQLSADQRLEALDRWLIEREHELKVVADEEQYSAFYRPATDTIHMPPFECFNTPEHYYGVLFHEATHWTGAKHRLDRLSNYKGEGWAREELVAELGAAFLCAEYGIENVTRDDHVNYIASWLEALKGDKRAIVTAASQASKAVELLEAIQPNEQKLAA